MAWTLTRRLSVAPNFDSIYKHALYTFRNQLRIFERRAIDHARWIEQDHVSLKARANQSTIV